MAFTAAATNDYLTGRKPIPTPAMPNDVTVRFAVTLATADLALNTVGIVGILPAGYVPVAVLFDSDDLDSNGTPTIAWSLGIANAGETDISTATADGGAAWGTGITTSQAGGQSFVTSKALSRVQSSGSDRKLMLKATAGAATAVAGEVGVTMTFRAVQ